MSWQTKDPLSKIPIKVKLPLGFIALYFIVFAIGSYFVITSVYSPLNREILLRLQSETLAQAAIFDKKLETLIRRAEDFASDGFIRTQTEILSASDAGTPRSQTDLLAAHNALQNHLRVNKLPLIKEFLDLQIYDLKLRKLVGIRPDAPPLQDLLVPIVHGSGASVSAIIPPNDVDAFPTAAIVKPIWDIDHKNRIGYLACHFQLELIIESTLLDYFQAMPESGMEKHLTIVDQSGLRLEIPWWYLRQIQSQTNVAIPDETVGLKILPADPAAELVLHIGKHACQNGQEMFGQSYPLKSAGWNALLELNATDALAPVRVLEGRLLGIAIIVALTTLVLLFFPIQYLIRPLGELERVAARIKEGDFSGRVDIHSQDEIGSLAKTFNLMARAIEERTQSLEQTASDLQKRERELRIQHDRLNTVVHAMTDGLILLNARGQIVLSNKAAEPVVNLLSRTTDTMRVRKCEVNKSRHENCVPCLLDTTNATACVLTLNDRIFEVISTKLPTLIGAPGKILMVRDITERERMNERQAHQERLTVLGKTAAVVAHELNSPLAAISMYNQMMEAELPEDSPFREHVEVINRNTQTCQRIIKDLLEYARTPQPKIEKIDLHEILQDVLRLLGPLNKDGMKTVASELSAKQTVILGDATQVQQVFVNLLLNAMQAIPDENGRVFLKTYQSDDGGTIIAEVEDNGTGIEEKYKEEIFEPFFTTKSSGGTGLGLPIARRIIEAHNGKLSLVTSEAGRTIFRVTLPVALERSEKLVVVNAYA